MKRVLSVAPQYMNRVLSVAPQYMNRVLSVAPQYMNRLLSVAPQYMNPIRWYSINLYMNAPSRYPQLITQYNLYNATQLDTMHAYLINRECQWN